MNVILAGIISIETGITLLYIGIVIGLLYLLSRLAAHIDKERARKKLHEKIEKAKAEMLEDGVISGPGKYIRRRRAHGSLTDGDTKGVKNPGWHGTPWP